MIPLWIVDCSSCVLILLLCLHCAIHLQDVRKYKLGLYFALRFYLTMKQQQQQSDESIPTAAHSRPQPRSKPSSSSGGPPGSTPRQSVGGFARSEGIGAEPQQLEQWILSLVLGHAAATLTESAASATVEAAVCAASPNGELQLSEISKSTGFVPAAVMKAAEACVCACLLLSRTDVLFGRVFQLFAQQEAVPGALGALVETIELAVLSDLLQGLAPEVMQVGVFVVDGGHSIGSAAIVAVAVKTWCVTRHTAGNECCHWDVVTQALLHVHAGTWQTAYSPT